MKLATCRAMEKRGTGPFREVGQLLRDVRHRVYLGQNELAAQVGISAGVLSDIERGNRAGSRRVWNAIVKHAGLEPDEEAQLRLDLERALFCARVRRLVRRDPRAKKWLAEFVAAMGAPGG